MTYLFLLDPEYVYLLPNASISKCGPDKLRLDLVKEDTLSDLYSYIPIVALRAFCKLENGLCVSSPICAWLFKVLCVGSNYQMQLIW